MQLHLTAFKQAVASVQLVQFPPEKQQKFQQGLREVQAQVSIVEQSLEQGDLALAQQQLAAIDVLKKQYHQERSVSFWQLLFGNTAQNFIKNTAEAFLNFLLKKLENPKSVEQK